MNIFYDPDIKAGAFVLTGEEAWHGIKVLRLKEGDKMFITNGKGTIYEADVLAINKNRECALNVIGIYKQEPERKTKLQIAVAPTKNIDRFEWFLEKATECGIDEITPVLCENSERTIIKPERLNKIIVSAMKQSKRAWLPKLNPVVKFDELISIEGIANKYIAHCAETEKKLFSQSYNKGNDAIILIGPEGDFSSEELSLALENNFLPISLGNYRLRTETAAVVACVEFNCLNLGN